MPTLRRPHAADLRATGWPIDGLRADPRTIVALEARVVNASGKPRSKPFRRSCARIIVPAHAPARSISRPHRPFALAPPGTSSRSASPCGRSSCPTHSVPQQNDGSPARRKTISHAAPFSRSQRAVRPSPRHRSTAYMSIGISSATGSPFWSSNASGKMLMPSSEMNVASNSSTRYLGPHCRPQSHGSTSGGR